MRSPHRRQAPLIAPRTAHARARELADIDQLLEDTPALAKLVAGYILALPPPAHISRAICSS